MVSVATWTRELSRLIGVRDAIAVELAFKLADQADDPERLIPRVDHKLLADFRRANEAVKGKLTERAEISA